MKARCMYILSLLVLRLADWIIRDLTTRKVPYDSVRSVALRKKFVRKNKLITHRRSIGTTSASAERSAPRKGLSATTEEKAL